jgi:hypothetical protein
VGASPPSSCHQGAPLASRACGYSMRPALGCSCPGEGPGRGSWAGPGCWCLCERVEEWGVLDLAQQAALTRYDLPRRLLFSMTQRAPPLLKHTVPQPPQPTATLPGVFSCLALQVLGGSEGCCCGLHLRTGDHIRHAAARSGLFPGAGYRWRVGRADQRTGEARQNNMFWWSDRVQRYAARACDA